MFETLIYNDQNAALRCRCYMHLKRFDVSLPCIRLLPVSSISCIRPFPVSAISMYPPSPCICPLHVSALSCIRSIAAAVSVSALQSSPKSALMKGSPLNAPYFNFPQLATAIYTSISHFCWVVIYALLLWITLFCLCFQCNLCQCKYIFLI